jgi:hypothetical protein
MADNKTSIIITAEDKASGLIGTIGTARRTGYNPTFLGSSAAYFDLVHKLATLLRLPEH